MIQNEELKKQEEAVQCMDKDLEHLSLNPASVLLPAVYLLCDFGQVSQLICSEVSSSLK